MRNTVNHLSEKSAAPALDRGLTVLELLADGPLHLEQCAQAMACPKASLLRIKDTLIHRGYISKGSDKAYSLLKSFSATPGISREEIIHRHIRRLAQQVNATVEWYACTETGAKLIDRHEPDHTPVRVRATLGFERNLPGELDAVASTRLYLQDNLLEKNLASPERCWRYQAGERIPCSEAELHEQQRLIRKKSFFVDEEYNSNGIRRMAAFVEPIQDETPSMSTVGILAIAEAFTPNGDKKRQEILHHLLKSTGALRLALAQ